jgi:DHA1 family inner membrane transport protein
VLIAFMGIFVLGNAVCALAPNYPVLIVARIIVACGHGLFFGIAAIVATKLMPTRQGFAVSMIFTGVTVAQLLGVPIGTAIGNSLGWRATFWAVGAAAALATVALATLLPPSKTETAKRAAAADEIRALNHHEVYLTYLGVALVATGTVNISTYLVPLMTDVTHIPLEATAWFLLIFGAGGLVGNFIGGRLADWKLMPSLIALFFGQALLQIALIFTSRSAPLLGINLFLVAAVAFSYGAHVTKRILFGARAAPNLASTLSNTAFNIGIASGAGVGGAALTAGFAYDQLPWLPFAFCTAGGCVAVVSMLLDRRAVVPVVEAA